MEEGNRVNSPCLTVGSSRVGPNREEWRVDPQVSFEKSLGIRVYSAAELNTLLNAKWEAMTDAMWDGDVDAAVAHFSPRTREVYADEMSEMSAVLDQIAADMQGIELVALKGDKAIYDLRIVKDGIPYSFHLEFQLDEDGLWRIQAF